MNERIQELATQTGYIWHASGDPQIYEFTPEKLEKFVELITDRCISLMEWQKISPKDDGAYNSALSLAQRNIKEHFDRRNCKEQK